MFLFSQEVVSSAGWKAGELLDLSCDGSVLTIKPSPQGRTLHVKAPFVQFSFAKAQLKEVTDFLGFDLRRSHFWDHYMVEGKQLILYLTDRNVPVLA